MSTPARSLVFWSLILAACASPSRPRRDEVLRLSVSEEPLADRATVRGAAPASEADAWWRSFAARLRRPQVAASLALTRREEEAAREDLRLLARLSEDAAWAAAEAYAEALVEAPARRPLVGAGGVMAAALLPDLTIHDPQGPEVSESFLRGLLAPVFGEEPSLLKRWRGQVVLVDGREEVEAVAELWGALEEANRGLELEAEAYLLQVPEPSALPVAVRWARGIDFGSSAVVSWAPSDEAARELISWSWEARGARILAEPVWRFPAGAESLRGWSRPGEMGEEGAGLGLRALALRDGSLRVEARLRLVQLDAVRPLFPRRFDGIRDERAPTQRRLTGLRFEEAIDIPAGRWRWFPLGTLPGVEGRSGPRYGLLLRVSPISD